MAHSSSNVEGACPDLEADAMGSNPFVLAKAGTQGDRLRPLDSRLRGNERRFGLSYATEAWMPATGAGMTGGGT